MKKFVLIVEVFVPIESVDSYIGLRFQCGRIWLCLFTFARSVCEQADNCPRAPDGRAGEFQAT
jgi:hypothetical protein